MERNIVSVFVRNHFGVLARVASMFRRRGFNIDTLTVGETENSDYSRITVTFKGDEATKNQIIRQLNKMPDVVTLCELERGNCVSRVWAILKHGMRD